MNTIDAILYINLDHREDRKIAIENELLKIGFNPTIIHRIPAVYNKSCGHLGCGQSHIQALELSIQKRWKRVIIIEDDFHFNMNTYDFNTWIEEADTISWDVLLLAKGHTQLQEIKTTDRLRRVDYCTTTPGYIIQDHYYETLRDKFIESVQAMNKQLEEHIEFYTGSWKQIGREFETLTVPIGSIVRYGTPSNGYIEKTILTSVFEATNDYFGKDTSPGRLKFVQLYSPENNTPLIPKLVHGVNAIDIMWTELQKRDKFYIGDPVVGYQGGFSSDTF